VRTGFTTEEQSPQTSQTVVRTDYSETPTYEDWGNMQGNEAWSEYAKRLGLTEPTKPVYDEDKKRRLKQAAILKSVSQGLASLGDMFSLGIGGSVEKRDVAPISELEELKTFDDKYKEELDKYNNNNFFRIAHDYENARRNRYLSDREAHSTKTSTTKSSGGQAIKDIYENKDWVEARETAERRLKSMSGNKNKENWLTYPHKVKNEKGETYNETIKYKYQDKSVSPNSVRGVAIKALNAIYDNLPDKFKNEVNRITKTNDNGDLQLNAESEKYDYNPMIYSMLRSYYEYLEDYRQRFKKNDKYFNTPPINDEQINNVLSHLRQMEDAGLIVE
jgi:hypothetical protein